MIKTTTYFLGAVSLTLCTLSLSDGVRADCPTEADISSLHTNPANPEKKDLIPNHIVEFNIGGQKVDYKVLSHTPKKPAAGEQLKRSGGIDIRALPASEAGDSTCSFSIEKKDESFIVTLKKVEPEEKK